jgi:hypothetical protein
MSEPETQSAETCAIPGRAIFSPEQLTYLQATVVSEIAPVIRAKEVYEKAQELAAIGGIWSWSEDILGKSFINFFSDGERVKHQGKILDINDMYMPLDMGLETDHPAISGRTLGEFELDAVNLENGQVIISSVVKKDDPDELEGEIEAWFSFVVDPNLPDQAVHMIYMGRDDNGYRSHQALLPVLAGEVSTDVQPQTPSL